MDISQKLIFMFFGILLTILIDLYSSSLNNIFLCLAFIRIMAIFIALFYRIIYDNYNTNINDDETKLFWNSFKNLFTIVAIIEQIIVIYYIKFLPTFWTILCIIQQVSMPLLVYLWIRRIQREKNFCF